jgi:hypothetical protein
MLSSSVLRIFTSERDCIWIEIPIERHPSLGDLTFHSEILICQKREYPNISKGMPHVEKILFNVEPASPLWATKSGLTI